MSDGQVKILNLIYEFDINLPEIDGQIPVE